MIGARVSMTYPEHLRRQCMIDGERKLLTPMEVEMLTLFLVTPPDRFVGGELLVEVLWPDPDNQALTASKIISILVMRLRKKGVPIETDWGLGYRIPEHARGGRPVRQYVPVFIDEPSWYSRRAA